MSYVAREHVVPRFLLQRFTDNSGVIWAYDKQQKVWFQTTPINIGIEKGIYDQAIEQWLSNIVEGPASALFQELDAGKTTLSRGDLFVIARFITIQRVRVRAIEKFVELNQPDLVREKFQETLNELFGESGIEVGSEILNLVGHEPEELLGQLGLRNICNLALHGAMWSTSNELAESIVDMAWRLICADAERFILTDNPAVLGIPNKASELPECVLPISKNQALHMGLFGVSGSLYEIRQDDELVRTLNRRVLAGADRFVYTPTQQAWISKDADSKFIDLPELDFEAPFIPCT